MVRGEITRRRLDYDAGWDDGYAAGFKAGMQVDPWAKKRKAPGEPFFEMRGAEYFGPTNPRKKRRKTAYQSAYSAAYKRLKKKHPRMSFGSLSKKAHAAARKKVK